MTKLGFTDTLTGKTYNCGTWAKTTLTVCQLSKSHNDWMRYLPFCNGWNLDYPEEMECPLEYRARMIDMAIGLQLI